MNIPRQVTAIIAATAVLAYSAVLAGCRHSNGADSRNDRETPSYLEIEALSGGGWRAVSVSPFDGSRDTLDLPSPLGRLIVMSTSHYGFLDALGRTDVVVGVSGADYLFLSGGSIGGSDVSSPTNASFLQTDSERSDSGSLRGTPFSPPGGRRGDKYPTETIVDVGYEAAPDYEKIVAARPDLLLTYSVSGAESPFLTKLRSLGIRVFVVNEHLESHPLARARYIRLFGALTGRMEEADSVLASVETSYKAIADSVSASATAPRKVLLNIPYNDQWFVPSQESYLTTLVSDAGGKVLGTEPGRAASSCMSLEKAYSYSKEADCWLNVGWCRTIDQLISANPLFGDMVTNITRNAEARGIKGFPVVWNDNLRVSGKGGNDIWQSGVVRPDLVLRDLAAILHPGPSEETGMTYYRYLE